MKKTLLLLLCALFVLMCACSSAPSESTPPAETPQQAAEPSPTPEAQEPEAEPTEEPVPTQEPVEESEPTEDPKAIAESFIDKQVSELYDAIGYPQSSDYAPSCLGSGEDGNLYYEGFTVYTYREGDSEIVSYVE